MELFDTHAHYNDKAFSEDLEEVLEKVKMAGITKLVCIGYNLESSKKAVELANKYDFIYATCGISPNDINENSMNELKSIYELAENNQKVVAIGEIGLDYYWNKENSKIQKEIFKAQIDLANKLNLPITIHSRDAYIDTIKVIKENPCKNTGIFHCCPLNVELIKDALKLGYYISFSGVITFKNAKPEMAIKEVPLEKLLIETDCPYMSPEPYRGKRNDSSYVIEMARKLAIEKNIALEEIAEITYKNAEKIYKI